MIKIKGIIGDDYTYAMFIADLAGEAESLIEIEIDSIGGYVDSGLTMYEHMEALRKQGKRIRTRAVNECMSIASILFMGGDERLAGCDIMIHNPWGTVTGNAQELKTYTKEISAVESQLEKIYAERSGQSVEVVSKFMDLETYIKPDEAVRLGFATGILTSALAKRKSHKITSRKAKAIINKNVKLNLKNMSKQSIMDRIKNWRAGVKAAGVLNLEIPTTDGRVLILEKEEGLPEVGDRVLSEDGTYPLEGNIFVVVVEGVITEVENEMETIEELTASLREADEIIADLATENEQLQVSQMTAENQAIVNAVKAAGGLDKFKAGATASKYRPAAKHSKDTDPAGGRYKATNREAMIEAAKERRSQSSAFKK